MAATKYGDYLQTLKYTPGRGGANARELVFVGGDLLQGFELNFIVGVYDTIGDWAPDMGAHTHPFDEFLLFFGYDDKDISILGSDMHLEMGQEYEPHKFSVPTVISVPANLPHNPLVTEKVYRDFGHFHVALSSKYAGGKAPKQGTTNGKKYTHLFKTLEAKKGPGGAAAVQQFIMEGKDLAGMPVNFRMGLYNKTGEWYPGKGAQIHSYDTAMVFFGTKTEKLSYLGAEITIELGKEREKHTFDVPTVVAIPKGTPHFPITCNKLERPYRMMEIGLSAKYDVAPAK